MNRAVLLLTLPLLVLGCEQELDPYDQQIMRLPRVEVHFNYPGSRLQTGINPEADDILVQLIDRANTSLDFAIMGFTRDSIVDAIIRAYYRGVHLRFVGNAKHMFGHARGYHELEALNIEMQMGNQNHIMHDKFFIIDRRLVVTGTGNITSTGYGRNDNNWVLMDSPQIAQEFTDEIEQMLRGRFGFAKEAPDNGNVYVVGDSEVEVRFSPQEDAMGRILQAVEEAEDSIEFMIFAFTKDQMGSLFVSRQREFEHYNACCDPARAAALESDPNKKTECAGTVQCKSPFRERYVRGVVDRSQLHSNGPYHEVYRLLANGIDVRMDGNDNSYLPGDYQAGGGRQHAKTLVIDGQTEQPVVLTGSFNWSSSATIANDETLVVIKGRRVGRQYAEHFDYMYRMGKRMGERWIGDRGGLKAGDVVINELGWDGYNGLVDPAESEFSTSNRPVDFVFNDEFVELLNTTDEVIDMSLWTLASDNDFMVGFYPGTIIGPHERFLLVDHNTLPYDDLEPQMPGGAYLHPNFVMNMANDGRFLRINLHNAHFRVRLLDPRGRQMDMAGNGGAPFVGGREWTSADRADPRNQLVRSMERKHFDCSGQSECDVIRPGDEKDSWEACGARGEPDRSQIREAHLPHIMASPGVPNSGGEQYGPEDTTWRSP